MQFNKHQSNFEINPTAHRSNSTCNVDSETTEAHIGSAAPLPSSKKDIAVDLLPLNDSREVRDRTFQSSNSPKNVENVSENHKPRASNESSRDPSSSSSKPALTLTNQKTNCVHSEDLASKSMHASSSPTNATQDSPTLADRRTPTAVKDISEYPMENIIIPKAGGPLGISIVGGIGHTSHPFGIDEPGIFVSKVL